MKRLEKFGIRKDLTVGEVAARSGAAVSAIHFYEAQGLIKSWRTAANHRRYSRDMLRRIAIIKVAQRAGVPLAEIKTAFNQLPDKRTPTAQDWQKLSAKWKTGLDRRISQLTQLRDQMTNCIGCGCLSIKECPLRNPRDILGKQGPGPNLLDLA